MNILLEKEVAHFSKVYDDIGYEQPLVVDKSSDEAKELFKKAIIYGLVTVWLTGLLIYQEALLM